MALIDLRNISKRFPDALTPAVDNVSLSVEQGDIYRIIGFSGAGKSILLRTINLLERPDSGNVLVEGPELTTLPKEALRRHRLRIGMIFQHFNLIQNATVFENVSFPLEIAGIARDERRTRVDGALQTVGLSEKALAYPAKLSGGQKQRVGIARTLVARPTILLCDEPTSALDPQTTDGILEFLQKLNSEIGLTIVFVTHEMHVVNSICNKVSVMEHGRVVDNLDLNDERNIQKTGIASCLFANGKERQRHHA